MPKEADVVDAELAQHLARVPDPTELFAADQGLATFHRILSGTPIEGTRLVRLECEHFTVTRNTSRAKCPRCGQMIRAGFDYAGFRDLAVRDSFSWPDDPLRALHE